MANTISISVNSEDIKNLQVLKVRDDIGASSVMRVGIQHLLNKPRIQAEQMNLAERADKLYRLVKKLECRIHQLETAALKEGITTPEWSDENVEFRR